MQLTSTEFHEKCQTCSVHLTLEAPKHQEMKGKVEMTRITLRKIAHSLMAYVRVSKAYINLALIYTAYNIFPVLPIQDLINKDVKPTTPFKLVSETKPSIPHLRVLLCLCVVRKSTAHAGTEELNMRHQAQKGFCGISVQNSQHQKYYLVYVPQRWKIISL